jgi:hypothetical protein
MIPIGATFTFRTPYDQHRDRDGQQATVVRHYTEDDADHDITEVGPMYRIRFADGTEIEAWPEEVEPETIKDSWAAVRELPPTVAWHEEGR